MKIKFCGANKGVTGSCHKVTTANHQILMDCGQFQGRKKQEEMNREEFPFSPEEIECVVLSHAHIDHCGRLPLLVKRGFKGRIICTDATADLLDVMLKDSGYIHEKEAEWQNRKNERAGRPLIEPLYTFNDAVDTLKFVEPVLYDQLVDLNEDMKVVFNDAGHILGSAIIELFVSENDMTTKLVFSGDLGVKDRPILRDPVIIKKADYVIMETTYGNRVHPKSGSSIEALMEIVEKTVKRGGTVVIPSFAVGRTQELIYELNRYYTENNKYSHILKGLKVYVDSPMATTATEVFRKNAQVFDDETKEYILKGENPLDFEGLEFTRSTEDSKLLNENREPKIIISASGMCEAGRIRHHLKHNLWDSRSSIVFVGYQAEGTLGRTLLEGVPEVRLFGEDVKVSAEIHNLEGFSGHADKNGLLSWLSGFQKIPKQVFLVHGETESKEAFAATVREKLNISPMVINGTSEFEVESGSMLTMEETIKDALDEDAIKDLKTRITKINTALEEVLKNSSIAVGSEIGQDKVTDIHNSVINLEKDVVQLSAALVK